MHHPVYHAEITAKEKRAHWENIVQAYANTQISRPAYAKKHGLNAADLSRWCYRLNKINKERCLSEEIKFVPLTVEDKLSSSIELFHDSGFRLQITQDSDEGILKKVLKLLQGLNQ